MGLVSARILYVINKTIVKDLCITQDLLKHDNFVQADDSENIFFK